MEISILSVYRFRNTDIIDIDSQQTDTISINTDIIGIFLDKNTGRQVALLTVTSRQS